MIIGIGIDQKRADYEKFARKMKAVVHDASHKAAATFGPAVMPTSDLVDRRGVVRHIHHWFGGANTNGEYVAQNEALLGKIR